MTNDKPPDPNRQLSLFDFQLHQSIRQTNIDETRYFSILDVFEHYGNGTGNHRREWETTRQRLIDQGFDVESKVIQHQFEGQGQRLTPVATFNTFLRIAQSTDFKDWESIRQFMADVTEERVDSLAERHRQHDINKLERAGYGDHPATQRLRDRNHSIVQLKALKAAISKTCDQPRWGEIHNSEYLALFGEVAGSLKTILNTKDIRDGLPTPQLRALTYSESLLEQVIAQQNRLTQQQILDVIEEIVKPIGSHLQEVCNRLGVHHITGRNLIHD